MSKLSVEVEPITAIETWEECGAYACRENCLIGTDWCKSHQHKEDEEVGFVIPEKLAEKFIKYNFQ